MHEDIIATYEDGGRTYEIDHLGISSPIQWGDLVAYCDGEMVAEFCIPPSLIPVSGPERLPPTGELIEMAKDAVADRYASDENVAAHLELRGMIGRNLPPVN